MSFVYVLLAFNLLAPRQVPAGTQLHVRLTTTIGSYASQAGDPVSAVLIASVVSGGETILPEGSTLSGKVKSVQRVGLGFIHELAALDFEFTGLTLPNGERLSISSRLREVENGRERVASDGSIRGERATGRLSYRAGGYIRTALQWEVHAQLAVWAIKALLVQVTEPELYYPAGVELTLALTQPLEARVPVEATTTPQGLTDDERARMTALIAALPARTYTSHLNRPSDLVNILFIGSREQLTAAFENAGWTQAQPATLRADIRRIRAVADGHGFRDAPMSVLLVDNREPAMSWQKGFNDVAKRHHIRIWKNSETWDGREIWIGAATHDIDFAYWRPGRVMTHRIDGNVDQERDKVVHDLVFTACVDLVDYSERPDIPSINKNATGDQMNTDRRLAVVGLNACETPPRSPQTDVAQLPAHGNGWHRFARREILSFRSDLLRGNPYWRSYEGIRWVIAAVGRREGRTDDHSARHPPDYEPDQRNSHSQIVRDMLR
jgi:LssY C-terminus